MLHVIESSAAATMKRLREGLAGCILGQEDLIEGLLVGFAASGHILVEGAPGLAKTLAVRCLAALSGLEFKRIQFTPDLIPSDLVGSMVYRQETGEFLPRKGPLFANILLADEINRAPAKVQSALLEAMEEAQVTLGDTSHPLPDPFFVMATQNPIEHEGTYPLPEAELDRFAMKLLVEYPDPRDEARIVASRAELKPTLPSPLIGKAEAAELRKAVEGVAIDSRVIEYIVALASSTRPRRGEPLVIGGIDIAELVEHGASPRASIALARLSKARALAQGRAYVLPEDAKALALPALRHRLVMSYRAESEGVTPDEVIGALLSHVPVP
jgi:MoxR-like ATPase